jgi:peptidoglycan/LPS O-acetylase OafA/YrhL
MTSLTDTRQLTYRADIDGLRALSVVEVILFHFSVPGFSGGFIGVDIFFVISGYLITQLLVSHSDLPFRRWLAEFYVRRARRILPALLLVLLVSTVVAWWLFAP